MFPARAGMDRRSAITVLNVPRPRDAMSRRIMFPARAGMDRDGFRHPVALLHVPRPRGDGPASHARQARP